MLSAAAYSLRQKARLAISLAWVGGFIDAMGFVILATFTSNMTGNTAAMGARAARGEFAGARRLALVIVSFIAGAVLSGLLTEGGKRKGFRAVYSLALSVEVALLAICLAIIAHGWAGHVAVAMILPLAMGLQNATITQIAGAVVRTTHVTGVLTDLGLESVRLLYWFRDRTRGHLLERLMKAFYLSSQHPSLQRLLLLGSIWASFLLGAALGVFTFQHWGAGALAAPMAFLVLVIAMDLIQPIAVMDMVDHAHDDVELKRFGIDPGVLPPTIGVFRVEGKKGRKVRPPDLGQLANTAGRHLRVVILILSPDVRLDTNSLAGLQLSLAALRATRRELVVCVSETRLFLKIRDSQLGEELGQANLCSDPEFAVARALELTT